MDIDEVLIPTVPGEQYRELARCTGLEPDGLEQFIEASGLPLALQRGEVGEDDFVAALAELLSIPHLPVEHVRRCWQATYCALNRLLAQMASRLAAADRLVLVGNSTVLHWPVPRRVLSDARIYAPAYLSFALGQVKPDPEFFDALISEDPARLADAVYVDAGADNVVAAARAGLHAWRHTYPDLTAAYLAQLLTRRT